MHDVNIDMGVDRHGLDLGWDVKHSLFDHIRVHCSGDGATTYAGIRLAGATPSTHNCFSNILGRHSAELGGTRRFDYIIEEVDANQDYNNYSNITALDYDVAGLRILGANSSLGGGIIGKVAIA